MLRWIVGVLIVVLLMGVLAEGWWLLRDKRGEEKVVGDDVLPRLTGCWGDKGVKWYSELSAEWTFKVVSDGGLITEPMKIPISDTETVTMLTGFKGYYCVREGEKPVAKHVVIPTVVEFPDGRLYRFRGGTIIDDSPLSKDEAMKDVIGGVKGETMAVFVSPVSQATFDALGIKEVDAFWVYAGEVSDKFYVHHQERLEGFFAHGSEEIRVVLPSTLVIEQEVGAE